MPELVRVTSPAAERLDSQLDGPIREFLVFALQDEEYGVELKRVREILNPPPLTMVPRAPAGVMGVCSVRGMLTTIFDLRQLLSFPNNVATRRSRVLLIDVRGEAIGFFVDEVRHVLRMSPHEVETADAGLAGEFGDHVVGIGRPSGGNVVLIDPSTLVMQ